MALGVITWTLLVFAFVCAVAIGIQAVRRPILFRMAARNAARRPRQTATVIAGLMVGTAIISSALVAGDSAGYAIQGAVYDALGHVDETVHLEGYPFYPEAVLHELRSNPDVAGQFDGMAPNVLWELAATNPRTDLFEPRVAMVGFEPDLDADFGDFTLSAGAVGAQSGSTDGKGLGVGQAIVTQSLADRLDIEPGDRLNVAYTRPMDPLLPEVVLLEGNLAASANPTGGLLDVAQLRIGDTFDVPVDEGATRITVVLGWTPVLAPGLPPTTQLQATLTAPDGSSYSTPLPPPGSVEMPAWLNLTADPGQSLPAGDWTVTVAAGWGLAANVDYRGAAVVLYPVYDLQHLAERARSLEAELGAGMDEIAGRFSDREEASFIVVAVTNGGRGNQFDLGDALFVRLDEAQDLLGRKDQINVIKFSNPGGIEEGAIGTASAVALLEAALADLPERVPSPAVAHLQVQDDKRLFLEVAENAGQLLTSLLLFAGSLSIISGLLLIVNIFTMLAEERRSELGMARAVGLTRRDLVRLFLFEGSLYAVAAAAIGAILGFGLAAGMVAGLNAIVQSAASEQSFPAIPFRPSIGAYLAAFAGGASLTFATIFFASRRLSRLNIVRAIRRIEEPERSGSRALVLAGIPLVALGLFVVTTGWLIGQFTMQVFGAAAAALGLSFALRRTLPRRRLYPLVAALLAIYYAVTYFTITEYDNPSETNIVGPIRGVILTLCVVVLVVHWERGTRLLGRALAKAKTMRAIALPAVGYPLHRKFRTGMTLAIFSIVILAIGFFSIFGALFETDPAVQTGGFDVEASTTLNVENLAEFDRGLLPAGLVTSQQKLVEYETFDRELITVEGELTGHFGPPHHHIFGIEPGFVDDQDFRLLWRLPEYVTDDDAYQALLERDDVVIVSYPYSTDERNQDLSNEVGDTLTIHAGNCYDPVTTQAPAEAGKTECPTFTIIGIQEQYHFPGIFLRASQVDDLFSQTKSFYLFKTAPGTDTVEAAKLLERNYRDAGLDAKSSIQEVADEQEAFRQVMGAMKLFLGLGLIIGVLSLGIVTSRSVLERRQEIGVLRALGYTRNDVRRLFLVEVTTTVALGAAIGLACSILVTYGLWFSIIRDLNYPYVVPWGEIGVLLGVSYFVALLATLAPIQRSARVQPAEALRYVE